MHFSASEALQSGKLIGGRYEVERQLGQGGTSTVYAVRDLTTGRRVALKLLSGSSTHAALFEREYRTLSGLRHPQIVEVYDYGTDEQSTYYTMELLEGSDLSQQAPMSFRDACAALRDLAALLGLLHARRLVHRDLSPTNLWRTPTGALKLLDFGSLSPFGPASEIVGTPQFIAPEVLAGAPLDHRVDLFALGALGYWLLTRVHAYPAARLEDLRRCWTRQPVAPSELLLFDDHGRKERIPAELDALLLSLLRIAPEERPSSTAAVIDRLNSLAGLEPEQEAVAAQGYLESKSFVGRARELERMTELLAEARDGRGHILLIEGVEGSGRTRLLKELSVSAQLAGAVTLTVDPRERGGPNGALIALVTRLFRSLPHAVREAATDNEELLSQVSPELSRLFGMRAPARPSMPTPHQPGELQTALRDCFLEVARQRVLAVFVDDLQELDRESIDFLAMLAHAAKSRKLLVVATLERSSSRVNSAAVESLRGTSVRFELEPLNAAETFELLSSVFGRAPYLERIAERLRGLARGSPARTLVLARHLVAIGAARYADGMWRLPIALTAEQLPDATGQDQPGRLERLSVEALALARSLSVAGEGAIPRATCRASSDATPELTERALAELLSEGVLLTEGQELRFAHETIRIRLCEQLDKAAAADARRRLAAAELLSADGDASATVRASLHLLRAGERSRALRLLQAVEQPSSLVGASSWANVAAPLEHCVKLLREQGASDRELAVPLAALASAGYYVHRRYASTYGDEALAVLERTLHTARMRRLKPLLGGKAAAICALCFAWLALSMRGRAAPSLATVLRWFFFTCSSLARAAALCHDPDAPRRHAGAVEPLTFLGDQHPATLVHNFCLAFHLHGSDRPAAAVAVQRRAIAQLEGDELTRVLPPSLIREWLAALYFVLGLNELRRDGSEVLRIADQLEPFGAIHAMSADYLRASLYAYQGDAARAEQYRQLLEQHAIKLGTVWQVASWGASDAARIALRTHDPILMKRAAEELANLGSEIPSLAIQERQARGAYFVMRAKYREALALLEAEEEPLAIAGWSQRRSSLARAHRELGDPERARAICADVLARLSPDDLNFPANNLNVQIELALADAELRQFDIARRRLDVLLAFHDRYRGPLTLGALHEARASVALAEHDLKAARRHLTAMEGWYRPTGIPTLLELVDTLQRRLDFELQREEEDRGGSMSENDSQLIDRVKFLLTKSGTTLEERGQRVLQMALLVSRADDGFIMLPRNRERPLAQLGAHNPAGELVLWATERLAASTVDEATQVDAFPGRRLDENVRKMGKACFVFVPLWSDRDDEGIVAGLVLGGQQEKPRTLNPKMLIAMAQQLAAAKP